jgi:AcrR family transcriptional regulator
MVNRLRLATDERRAQLLALGRKLFNEHAYDELSVDDIAAAAGISKGLLYHYFPSKRVFYVETVRAASVELLALTKPPSGLDPPDKLRYALDAYLDYAQQNARAFLTLMRGGIGNDAEVAALIEKTRRSLVKRIMEQGLALKRARPTVRLALRGWLGFVEAASLDWLDHRDVDRDTLRATLSNALTHALTTAMLLDPDHGVELLPTAAVWR